MASLVRPRRSSPFSTDSQIYAEHLLERFRLFFLIALGETVLTIGNASRLVAIGNYTLIAMVVGIVAIADTQAEQPSTATL